GARFVSCCARRPPSSTLFPYPTLFRSSERLRLGDGQVGQDAAVNADAGQVQTLDEAVVGEAVCAGRRVDALDPQATEVTLAGAADRKSTRLNSSHVKISYAVFCLKKKK